MYALKYCNHSEERRIFMNKFMLNETSYHGAGAIKAIPEEIKSRGFKKVFVASDPDLVKFGVSAKVTDILEAAGIDYTLYSDIKPNPPLKTLSMVSKNSKTAVQTALSLSAAARLWILQRPSESLWRIPNLPMCAHSKVSHRPKTNACRSSPCRQRPELRQR